MNPSLSDRIISVLIYFTLGIFGIVWIIFANLTNKKIGNFLMYNLYQAIFISVGLCVLSLLYDAMINLLKIIPFVGEIVAKFHLFFFETPLYFSFTLSGFICTLFLLYLSVVALTGRKPYLPCISDVVKSNLGG